MPIFISYDDLKKAITKIPGLWVSRSDNHKQFRAENGGILNYWLSTGTIFYQGTDAGKVTLEKQVAEKVRIYILQKNKS